MLEDVEGGDQVERRQVVRQRGRKRALADVEVWVARLRERQRIDVRLERRDPSPPRKGGQIATRPAASFQDVARGR